MAPNPIMPGTLAPKISSGFAMESSFVNVTRSMLCIASTFACVTVLVEGKQWLRANRESTYLHVLLPRPALLGGHLGLHRQPRLLQSVHGQRRQPDPPRHAVKARAAVAVGKDRQRRCRSGVAAVDGLRRLDLRVVWKGHEVLKRESCSGRSGRSSSGGSSEEEEEEKEEEEEEEKEKEEEEEEEEGTG